MSKPFSEFTQLPEPFQTQETLAFTDLAPADAVNFAAKFLHLREQTWQTVLPKDVVSDEHIEQFYAPTPDNIAAQQRYMRTADSRTHYVAVTKKGADFPGLVALGKISSHLPVAVDTKPCTVELQAFDVLPNYQSSGVGTLLLHELLDFYTTTPHINERNFAVQVPQNDTFLLQWLERRGVAQISTKSEHAVCVGGVMTVRQELSRRLFNYGAAGHQRKFFIPTLPKPAKEDS